LNEQVEQYHFNTYAENWDRRPEVKRALASIPSVMMDELSEILKLFISMKRLGK
jgi:hypothetical protein